VLISASSGVSTNTASPNAARDVAPPHPEGEYSPSAAPIRADWRFRSGDSIQDWVLSRPGVKRSVPAAQNRGVDRSAPRTTPAPGRRSIGPLWETELSKRFTSLESSARDHRAIGRLRDDRGRRGAVPELGKSQVLAPEAVRALIAL
jgi:hypothetical protein